MSIPITENTNTILIVDDDELIRTCLKLILENAGYRVIVAGNGEDGVSRFKEHGDISLVLADVCMPKKNGKEFFEEISMIRAGTKVLFMSGYTDYLSEWVINERLEFIGKPFNRENILEKIQVVLDK